MSKDDRLYIRIPAEIKRAAIEKAEGSGLTLTDIITLLLKAWLSGEFVLKL